MEEAHQQSAVVFLPQSELFSREEVEGALGDIEGAVLTWHEEYELEDTKALSLHLEGQHLAISFLKAPLVPALYHDLLDASGLEDDDRQQIEAHGSHVRVISMKTGEIVEPADRIWLVYRAAVRLAGLGQGAVLAPLSGVFVMGVDPSYVDSRREENVPPMDLWVQVELGQDGVARSRGAGIGGIPEVELSGIAELEPDQIYSSVMDTLVFLRQIRRFLVAQETVHIGRQPWQWEVTEGEETLVKLNRIPLT